MECSSTDLLIKKLNEYIKELEEDIEKSNKKIAQHKKETWEFDEERVLLENWLSTQVQK